MIKKGKITLENGVTHTTYAEFNRGYSHIIIDDHCYQVVNGRNGEAKVTPWLFPEAVEQLKNFPKNPDIVMAALGY